MFRYFKTLVAALVAALMATAGDLRDAKAQNAPAWGGPAREHLERLSYAAEPAEFGALAFGESETGMVWAADFGDRWMSAKTAAVERCSGALGSPCWSWGVFPNRCVALAVSDCPEGSCSKPAYGVALGTTFGEAVAGAVAECESGASGDGVAGTCRAPVNDDGEPSVVCAGIGAVGDPHDDVAIRLILANAEWGALGFGESRTGAAWAFDFGDSEAAAESAAADRCAGVLGRSCSSWGAFSSGCVALAVSECPADSCSKPVYGVSGASTVSEAVTEAVRSCEMVARGRSVSETCRVAVSGGGKPGVVCLGRK